MDYYNEIKNKLIDNEIKNKLIDNEIYSRVKDYSKEKYRVITHYEVGKLLFEAGSCHGENVLGSYSKKLQIELGKKYNERTLRRMRQLYLFFESQKWSPTGTKLTISHIRELFCLSDSEEINYYVTTVLKYNLTRDELKEKIRNKEYERLSEETKTKLSNETEIRVQELIKEPIIIKNSKNYEIVSEKVLQRLILEDIPSFLNELGNGFTFVGNEYKIKMVERITTSIYYFSI